MSPFNMSFNTYFNGSVSNYKALLDKESLKHIKLVVKKTN